jgi:hypothetical protein
MSRIGHTTKRHPLCPECGYDLVATIADGRDVCPECGFQFEMHELVREVRPEDWTPWRGLRRMGLVLAARAVVVFLGWSVILWVTNALLAIVGPAVSGFGRVMLLLGAAVIIFAAGGAVGHLLARRAEEHAGFMSPLLGAVITIVAWAVILLGVSVVQATGTLGATSSTGVVIVAGGFALFFIIRTLYFSD